MENNKLRKWCEAAASKIRYGPDRAAVEAELMAHMEDKRDALRKKGIPEAELDVAVLRSMGSAEEIAPQLAAIHKPWLGYIYHAVKTLAVIACVFTLLLFLFHGVNVAQTLLAVSNFHSLPANYGPFEYYCHPNVSDTSDGYRFQITEAGFRADEPELCMELQITYQPWMREPNVTRYIWATDSEGNYYPSLVEASFGDIPRVSFGGSMSTSGILLCDISIQQFSTSAQWVELHYDRDGRDMVLRIELTGGDGA